MGKWNYLPHFLLLLWGLRLYKAITSSKLPRKWQWWLLEAPHLGTVSGQNSAKIAWTVESKPLFSSIPQVWFVRSHWELSAPAEVMGKNISFFGMSKIFPSWRSLKYLRRQRTPRASVCPRHAEAGFWQTLALWLPVWLCRLSSQMPQNPSPQRLKVKYQLTVPSSCSTPSTMELTAEGGGRE